MLLIRKNAFVKASSDLQGVSRRPLGHCVAVPLAPLKCLALGLRQKKDARRSSDAAAKVVEGGCQAAPFSFTILHGMSDMHIDICMASTTRLHGGFKQDVA
eukprot:361720-Chlamydomonas_euryale.AAC.4